MSKSPEKWVACGSEDTLATWVEDDAGKRVCTMRKCEQDWQRAQLIAASPELLIALQNLLEACTEAEEFKIRRGWQAAQARVAIAKATGKEQP